MRTLNASEFKARCLRILDEVAETGESVRILKRGREVARLVAPVRTDARFPQDTLRGTVHLVGDLTEPPVPCEQWDAVRGEWEPRE